MGTLSIIDGLNIQGILKKQRKSRKERKKGGEKE